MLIKKMGTGKRCKASQLLSYLCNLQHCWYYMQEPAFVYAFVSLFGSSLVFLAEMETSWML